MTKTPRCSMCKKAMIELGWMNGVHIHFCEKCDRANAQ